MKKLWIGVVSSVLVLCLFSVASAGPAIGGTWKGKVKKVTATKCAQADVTLSLTQCTGTNLVRGLLSIGATSTSVVGRIESNNVVSVSGSDINGTSYTSVSLFGTYTAGAPATILVDTVYIYTSSSPDQEFDVFTLTKQ